MARAIPTYEQQRTISGVQSAPTASSNVRADNPAFSGLANVGNALGNLAGTLQVDARKKEEDRASVEVANILSQGDVYWQENMAQRMKDWKVGDADLREGIAKDFDKWANENTAKLPTDASRKYFQQHVARLKGSLQQNAFTFQDKSTTEKLNAETLVGMEADKNAVYANPEKRSEVYARRAETVLARNDLSDAQKIKELHGFRQELDLSVERSYLQRDPAAWKAQRFGNTAPAVGAGGSTGFSAVINDVLRREGGYVGKDGNSGSPANFGINQKANPDIDVKGLTKEGAIGLYKDRYWDKIGGDNLPAGIQGTAMDAAVNQGVGNAKKWLQQSGGDPAKFNQLRRDHYESLLAKPEFSKYRKTWMERLEAYENQTPAGTDSPAPHAGAKRQADESAPATFKALPWEKQEALLRMAETQINQNQAKYKGTMDARLQDAAAMHADGKVDPFNIPEAEFYNAYGSEGGAKYRNYKASQTMAADVDQFSSASVAEIQQSVAASQKEIDDLANGDGSGYAAADSRQRIRIQAAQQAIKARDADPAAYAARNNPLLREAQAAIDAAPADGRPAATQQYVAQSMAEQQRLGIASPRVLTEQQMDSIAQRAMNATRPEDGANLIGALEAEYGAYFPKAFQELVKGGKIAGELQIIPNLRSHAAREAVSRLARVKEADLVQGLTADAQKSVKDEVVNRLSDFARAVPIMSQQAAGVVNSYESTLRKMAFQQVQAGVSPSDAVDNAQTLLLGHYKFDGTMRIPTTEDPRKVKSGASAALKNIDGIDVPPDIAGGRGGDALAQEWTRTVQANPLWYTSDTDGGLELWAQGTNGVRYRVTRGGQPVRYTWGELTTVESEADRAARPAATAYRERRAAYRERLRQENMEFDRLNGAQ